MKTSHAVKVYISVFFMPQGGGGGALGWSARALAVWGCFGVWLNNSAIGAHLVGRWVYPLTAEILGRWWARGLVVVFSPIKLLFSSDSATINVSRLFHECFTRFVKHSFAPRSFCSRCGGVGAFYPAKTGALIPPKTFSKIAVLFSQILR